jgi:hypothetical protein
VSVCCSCAALVCSFVVLGAVPSVGAIRIMFLLFVGVISSRGGGVIWGLRCGYFPPEVGEVFGALCRVLSGLSSLDCLVILGCIPFFLINGRAHATFSKKKYFVAWKLI